MNPVTAELDQTGPDNLPAQESLAFDLVFDLWIAEGACAHANMRAAHERIANWAGLREFQHALRSVDEGSYANLLRELPNTNGGLTTPAEARACLAELDRFSSSKPFGQIVELVDRGSGHVVHARVGPYDGWLGTNGSTGITRRLTADGDFQVERGQAGVMAHDADAEILFRSKAFSQMKSDAGEFCLTDLTSGQQLHGFAGLRDASDCYPAILDVRQGQDCPARYAYCVEPLRRLFRAAIATDHPVLWC